MRTGPFLVTSIAPLSMSIVNRRLHRRETGIVAAYLRELRERSGVRNGRPGARSQAPRGREALTRVTRARSLSRQP